MSAFTQMLGGAVWNSAGRVAQFATSLVALAIVARVVGPADYGVFGLSWVAIGFCEIFVTNATIDTLVQRHRPSRGHANATFWIAATLACAALALLGLGAGRIADWLNAGTMLAVILPWRAAVLPVNALAVVPNASLIRQSRFRDIAAIDTAAAIVASALGIALALAGAGVWSLVAMEALRALMRTSLMIAVTGWRPGLRMRIGHFRDLFSFNANTWVAWGAAYAIGQLPRVMIAGAFGTHAVGLYGLATRLLDQIAAVLAGPIYQSVQAGIARAQTDRNVARELCESTLRFSALASMPLHLGLSAIAPLLVPGIFGTAWTDAVPIVQIVLLLGVPSSIAAVQIAVIRGMGKASWHAMLAPVSLVLTAAVIYSAIPYGLPMVAAALVVKALLIWPLQASMVRRLTDLDISTQLRGAVGAFAAAATMALVVRFALPAASALLAPLSAAAVLTIAGAIVYWLLLHLTAPAAAGVLDRFVAALVRRDRIALRAAISR